MFHINTLKDVNMINLDLVKLYYLCIY